MGYYTEISKSEYSAQDTALYNRMNGVSGHTTAGVVLAQEVPCIFMSLTTKIAEHQSAKENNETENTSEDAERKRLQKELRKALKDIGASDENDINEAVTRAQDARDTAIAEQQKKGNTEVQNVYNSYQTKIDDLNKSLTTETDENKITSIKNKIQDLQTKQEEKVAEAKQKAQEKLNKVIEKENKEVSNVCSRATEAFAILEALNFLNSVEEDPEPVKEQTEALTEFATHRNILNSKTESLENKKYGAMRLKKLAEENPNNKTLQNAYKMIAKQVEDILKGNDNYKTMNTSSQNSEYYKNKN